MRPHLLPLALLFLAFTAPSIAQKAEEGEVVVEVAEGAPLSVQCALSAHEHVQWRADGAAPAPDLRAEPERALPGAGTRVLASLRAEHARPHHAALYRCTPTAPPVRVRVLPAPPAPATAAAATLLRAGAGVAAPPGDEVTSPAPGAAPRSDLEEATGGDDVDAPKVEMLLYELGKALEFDCKLPDETAKFNYLWFKNGTRLSAGAAAGSEGGGGGGGGARAPALEQEGRKLVFRRAHEDEHGDYACVVGHSIAHRWRAEALSLARVPPNTNVVEGQKFSITCKLVGKPYRPVTWTYAPDESVNGTAIPLLNEAGGRFSTRDSTGGVPDGVLEARDAERADAGVYACVPAAGTAAASTLRVKDVYAALWPFLGICLEVFILCAIILVYEKRRTKPELDDSDADADAHAQ